MSTNQSSWPDSGQILRETSPEENLYKFTKLTMFRDGFAKTAKLRIFHDALSKTTKLAKLTIFRERKVAPRI